MQQVAFVPLDSYSCEVAVLCLALLGTNYVDFLLEANRVLANQGLLKVVETGLPLEPRSDTSFKKEVTSLGTMVWVGTVRFWGEKCCSTGPGAQRCWEFPFSGELAQQAPGPKADPMRTRHDKMKPDRGHVFH